MWKKTLVLLLVIAMTAGLLPTALAEDATVFVQVNVIDAGKIVASAMGLNVSDSDGDGTLTVNDALIAAHNKGYNGGAAAGYGYENSAYGISATKLWGKTHGGFGYCVDNTPANSLLDPICNGNVITAYTYSDLTAWSDEYAYFSEYNTTVTAGRYFSETLYTLSYDADWNIVREPLVNATIAINGEETPYKTDANGQVVLAISIAGEYILSASTKEKTIVTPVASLTVLEKDAFVITEEDFSDVPRTAWYYAGIMEASSLELLKGKDTQKRIFDPNANLTIGEYLTILYRIGENLGQYSGKTTTGVNWQQAASFMANRLGLTKWDLNKAITRGEMASATVSYIRELTTYTNRAVYTIDAVPFSDLSTTPYAVSIQFMQQIGLINGYTDGTFRPNKNIKRSEVAQIIYNFNHNLCLSEPLS